jgi:hypothetical protein
MLRGDRRRRLAAAVGELPRVGIHVRPQCPERLKAVLATEGEPVTRSRA